MIFVNWTEKPVTDRPGTKGQFVMNLTPAIFLDRDNTLTIDEGYNFEIDKFQWVNGAPLALHAFNALAAPFTH